MLLFVSNMIESIIDGFMSLINLVEGSIQKNVIEIGSALKCLYVVVMVCVVKSNVFDTLIITIFLMCVCYIVKRAYQKYNNLDSDYIPKPKERFTRLNNRGMIEIDKDRQLEMIQYLYELEEFLQGK